jgi:hypothetical protein
LPVVVVTASTEGLPVTGVRIVRKPVSLQALLNVVHEHCGAPSIEAGERGIPRA